MWQDDLVVLKNSSGIDAFGHLRVSIPEALVTILGQYDAEPLALEAGNTGNGIVPTHNGDTRMVRLQSGPGVGVSFLQTYNYWSYQPGRSQRIELTGIFGAAGLGRTQRYGYFDADNGLIYQREPNGSVSFVVRTKTSGGVVETVINQATWNLDRLDGSGNSITNPSHILLNKDAVFILTMDLEFLGMGRVRMGFNIGGLIHYAHEFTHANISLLPYMQTATLPVQVSLTTTPATVGTAEMFFKGALVMSEGGLLKDLGYRFATPERTVTAANSARTHLVTVRPKALFKGLVNRESYVTRSLELLNLGSNPVFWELVAGANFSVAPTYSDVNTDFSGTEVSTGGTFLNLTGGVVLKTGYLAGNQNQSNSGPQSVPLDLHHPLTLNRAGLNTPIGSLTLLVRGLGATSLVTASLNFSELR